MNAIIALCHFCENHGPSVLFYTQVKLNDCNVDCCLLNLTLTVSLIQQFIYMSSDLSVFSSCMCQETTVAGFSIVVPKSLMTVL